MPTLARHIRKLFSTRHLQLCFVLIFLLATCLPTATPVAQAAPLATQANAAVQQTTDLVPPAQSPLLPDATPLEVTAASATAAGGPPPKTLPAHLQLDLDRALLKVGETGAVTLTVISDGALNDKGAKLLLDLPNGLAATNGTKGKLRWAVPALALGETFQQVVQLTIDRPRQALKQGVLTLQATLSAPGADSLSTTRLLGVAPTTPTPETQATTEGAVLQNAAGDVMLLVLPGAVNAGVTFRYTELRRVPHRKGNHKGQTPHPLAASTGLTQTSPVALVQAGLNQWLYLPLASADAANTQVQATALLTDTTGVTETVPPPTATVQPVSDHNVEAYAIWQLDAQINGARVPTFTQEVQLVVAAGDWVAQGVDPARLNLWTRENATERWQLINSTYETTTQTFSAWLPHFSQFTLAQGLNNADVLPSVRAFSTDRTTGGATLQYPLETPKGLGGLTPQLSLSYSSIGVDDLYLDAGNSEGKAQVSGVGIGWEIGGISRIVRSSGNLDNQTFYKDREYTLSLNGTFVRIRYSDGAWRTDPEIFAKIDRAVDPNGSGKDYAQWTITTADGLVYTFGDASISEATFNAASATGTFVVQQNGGAYERLAKEWYLVSVQDRLGNRMDYKYQAEQGTENGCVPSDTAHAYLRWYVRAIYPQEILWSSNPSQGVVNPQMHVLFTYDPNIRSDWNITGSADNDCKLAKFAQTNRLLTVKVEVNAGGWQTLRSYQLSQDYNTTQSNTARRLMLMGIDQKGKNGTVLNHYSFGYNCAPGACAALVNTIRLQTAQNGLGGQINYTYTGYQPSASNSVCNNHCTRNAVTRTDVQDGLGQTTSIDYYYGPTVPVQSGDEWSAIDNTREFLGFKRTQATYYAPNTSTVVKWDQVDTWQGQRDDPDPRRGRIQHQEVRTGPGGTLLAVTDNTWNAYRRLTGAWDSAPTPHNSHTEGATLLYDTLWVRLDATSEWTAGVGKLTLQTYDPVQQNGQQFGNLTKREEWSHAETNLGYTTWASRVGSFSQLQRVRKTTTDYFPNPTLNLVNKPARTRIFDGAGACQAETRLIYDNLEGNFNSAPTRGLVAKIQQARTSCSEALAPVNDPYNATWAADWQETRMAYDAYGNQTVVHHVGTSTANDDHTTTTYDSVYHLFPILQSSKQNSTFQETATYYGVNGLAVSDPKAFWGAQQSYCAVNEVCVRQAYDEFGRRTYRWDYVQKGSAWDTTANASVVWGYANPTMNAGNKTTVITEWHAPRCDGNFVRKHYNGLGQLVAEQKPDQDWMVTIDGCTRTPKVNEIETIYAYDAFGQPIRASVPYRTNANFVTRINNITWSTVWNSTPNTATSYDTLGRPTQTTAPNGEATLYGYDGRVSSINSQDRAKATSQADAYRTNQWQEVDGLGYVANIRTWTYNGNGSWTENARVSFTHDATGNLLSVTHPNGIGTTTLSYDLLGHKLSMNDVDMGSWSYAYDRQGKLTRQTDARNQTTCLYYENVLERVLGKSFTTGASCPASVGSYNVNYGYDANHNAVQSGITMHSRGQLTSVSNNGWSKTLLYDHRGLLWNETVSIQGAPQGYSTWYGYDSYNRPSVVVYPDGETATTSFNSMGLPNRLNSNWSGDLVDGTTANGSVANGVNYDEAGRLRNMRFPQDANLWQSFYYFPWTLSPWGGADGNSNGRLWYIGLGTSANGYDKMLLDYRYDNFGNVLQHNANEGVWQNFTYDAQNRLTNGYSQPYNYDSAGRLTNYENNSTRYSTPVNNRQPHGVKWVNLPASGGAAHTLTIRALGQPAAGVWPQMELWVNGNKVTTWTVGGSWQNYAASVWLTGRDEVDVVFTNNAGTSTEDRNLFVDWIQVDSQTPQTYSAAVYDRSEGTTAFDGNDVMPGQQALWWSGAMRFVLGSGALALGYDANGNLSYKAGATQTDIYAYNVENRLVTVTRNGAVLDSYLYDADGQRVRKSSNGSTIYYPNQYYEHYDGNVDKYYYFNGQPVVLRRNGWLVAMHQDQIGNLMLVTTGGNRVDDQGFYAYGRLRRGFIGVERGFTGQHSDFNVGLIYMNARYYDPQLGQFISPDTLVPDATNVMDFNRYMYARGNPMKYNDPSGHCVDGCILELGAACLLTGICQTVANLVAQVGPQAMQAGMWLANNAPGVSELGNWMFSSNAGEQAAHSAGQNAGNSTSGDPNGPEDPFGFNRFSNLTRDRGFEGLQRDLQSGNASNRLGAERVLNVMSKLGDKVQNVNYVFKGQFRGGDIDIVETTGNIHSIGDHTKDLGYLGGHFQYLRQFVAQSANPNATITYWFTGDPAKLEFVQKQAVKWGVLVEVLK